MPASQSLAVPSLDAVASRRPSALKLQPYTGSVWLSNSLRHSPVAASQTLAVPASQTLARGQQAAVGAQAAAAHISLVAQKLA